MQLDSPNRLRKNRRSSDIPNDANAVRGVAVEIMVGVRFLEFFGWVGGEVSFYRIYFLLSFQGSHCLLSKIKNKIGASENRLGGATPTA